MLLLLQQKASMKRILVVQLRELGDCLLATPLIRQLKRLHPDATIDVLCEQRSDPIFAANPAVLNRFHWRRKAGVGEFLALTRQLRRQQYDLAVDSQSLPKTALLVRTSGAKVRAGFRRRWLCGPICYTYAHGSHQPVPEYAAITKLRLLQDERIDPLDLRLDFPLHPRDQEEADRFCQRWLRPPVAAIYATGRATRKEWPAEKIVDVADRLSQRGFQPFFVYGPGEEDRNLQIAAGVKVPAVVGYPMIPFPVLKEVLQRCALFVGGDGGAKHAARAAGVPTVTVFCRIPPVVWTHPSDRQQRFLAAEVPPPYLSPETLNDDRGTYFQSFEQIGADEVWAAVESLLSELATTPPSPTPRASQNPQSSASVPG